MAKQNREYKDSLFVDLFYSDETAKRNLLSLYNALHGTDFIPVRYAMYAGRAYEQVLDKRDRYKTKLVKIPTPEFYVFYNGQKDYPVEQQLSLSDAFLTTPSSNSMELTVTVININSAKSHEILDKCRILMEYSLFIDTVRKYRHEEDPIKKAIEECIQKGILAEYLMRKGSEVRNMLVAEYSYEEDIRVKQEEARMEGIEQGIEQGKVETVHRMLKMGISDFEMIALSAGLSVDEVTAIRDKEYAGS